jgi:hypothetical protein
MIQLSDTWYLDCDENAFVIQQKRIREGGKNVGEEFFDNQTWHSTYDAVKRKVAAIAMMETINGNVAGMYELLDSFIANADKVKR